MSLFGAALCLALVLCLSEAHDALKPQLRVPASFSYNHETHDLADASFVGVLDLLSSYEIDSHVDVVLVGSQRDFDRKFADALSEKLDTLSTVSAYASPLTYVHEKILYHIALGSTIESKVRQSLGPIIPDTNAIPQIDPTLVNNVLQSRMGNCTSQYFCKKHLVQMVSRPRAQIQKRK